MAAARPDSVVVRTVPAVRSKRSRNSRGRAPARPRASFLTGPRSAEQNPPVTQPTSTGTAATTPGRRPWQISIDRLGPDACLVRLTGSWRLRDRLPPASEVLKDLGSAPGIHRLSFDTTQVVAWDTGLLTFLRNLMDESARAGIDVDHSGLPGDVERLLALASTVPMRTETP